MSDVTDELLDELARQIGERLRGCGLRLATAESCTGGWVAKVITDLPGSSAWFDRGFVTYTNQAKQQMLGVGRQTLQQHGAVSEAAVREMAEGALTHSSADWSLSISGIAGPGGGTADKPVGTVWFGWAGRGLATDSRRRLFAGGRQAVRSQAVAFALEHLLERLDEETA